MIHIPQYDIHSILHIPQNDNKIQLIIQKLIVIFFFPFQFLNMYIIDNIF